MAANIEFNKKRESYSFYSLKQPAWHTLGQVVSEAKTPEEVMKLANLDYEVGLANLRGVIDENTLAPVDNYFATYRKDNQACLGVVGVRYEPVQNEDTVSFVFNCLKNNGISEMKDLVIETAGVLGKGERIFVTCKCPDFKVGNDDHSSYLMITSSHDGSGAITTGFCTIRIVCANTLAVGLRDLKSKISVKHTKNVMTSLTEASKILSAKIRYDIEQKEILERMQQVSVTNKTLDTFIANVVMNEQQSRIIQSAGTLNGIQTDEVMSARTLNKALAIRKYAEEGVGQDGQYKGTVYWMLQAISGYMQNGQTYLNEEDKFKSIFEGNGQRMTQKAFDLASTLI